MARGRSNKPKTPKKVDQQKIKFVGLESCKLTQYEADLTKGSKTVGPARDDDEFKGAVVKPVVRYNDGDEERANRMADRMVKQARERGAVHVYRPERIVIGKGKVRAPDLKPETPPLEAARMWMKEKRPPQGLKETDVRNLLRAKIENLPGDAFQRVAPIPFTVRGLSGENYGPFRDTWKLEIPGTGIFGVTGRYAGEAGRSNRAGKSALVGVARYAIYGESEYGRDQDKLVHSGRDVMKARAELAAGPAGVRCVFGRRYKRGGSAKAEIGDDVYKKTDFDEARDEALALPHEDFVRTQFVREGDLLGLLGQGSAQIKDDMMRWLGLQGWTLINRAVGEDLKDCQAKYDKLSAEKAMHQQTIDEGEAHPDDIKHLEDVVEGLELVNKQGDERELTVRDLERRIEVAESVATALEVVKGEKACRARLKMAVSTREKASEKAEALHASLSSLRSEVKECQKNLAGFDGECPVDGQDCPRVDAINGCDGAMKDKLRLLNGQLDEVRLQWEAATGVRDDSIEAANEMTRELREMGAAQDLLDQQGHKPESVEKLNKKLEGACRRENDDASKIENDLRDAREQLDNLRADLKILERAVDRVNVCDTLLDTLNRNARILRYTHLLTSKRGVPAMQIEGSARAVESMANEVLAAMGQDHRLEFAFEKELKKKEPECGACGKPYETGEQKCSDCGRKRGKAIEDVFLPMVIEGADVRSFDQESSGGKSMMALATRIALARFLGVVTLFLDEADKSLDDYNLEAFVKMLPRLLEQGFKQVFVISHREYVRSALPKCIEAVRHDGWSEVRWA